MFFALSKILAFFTVPSNLLFLIAVTGVVLMVTRFARTGRFLAAVGVILIGVAGLSPLGNALILPLEQRFPPWDGSRGAPDGIVVLGGAIGPAMSDARDQPSLNESAERMTAVADLARRYPAARVIFSGGDGSLMGGQGSEAKHALPLFESFGIPRARIELEDKSRNTAENAAFSKEIAAPKPGQRWLLLTSAHHMPRSIGCFRRAGFAVEAYPVDWRTRGAVDLTTPFASLAAGLARIDVAAREWIGLLVYWTSGRTSALFPAPAD
jgi:uncharacterized SAM-binding protein YcdF (DUF218 family)